MENKLLFRIKIKKRKKKEKKCSKIIQLYSNLFGHEFVS